MDVIRKGREQATLYGFPLTSTDKQGVLRILRVHAGKTGTDVRKNNKIFIVTPNPEIILRALVDQKLSQILKKADLSLPDGVGLAAAVTFNSLPSPKNRIIRAPVLLLQGIYVGFLVMFGKSILYNKLRIIKGRELFVDIIRLANKKGWRVFLLGGLNRETSEKARRNLYKSYKNIKIESEPGPIFDDDAFPKTGKDKILEQEVIEKINRFKPHIIFVGFRAPVQEKWVEKHLSDLDVSTAMVVGRTFEYIAGQHKTPPSIFENLGLEWLWRLFTGSSTKKRVFTAFPGFALKVFLDKLKK